MLEDSKTPAESNCDFILGSELLLKVTGAKATISNDD
jgi:hypothetical protein